MKPLVVDVETTIYEKGNPFSQRNRLCYYGAYPEGGSVATYDATELPDFEREFTPETLLVGFNIKFDLHWLRRCGVVGFNCRVWDCQIAYFLLTAQRHVLPSLDDVCAEYGIKGKTGSLDERYWAFGIDTPEIPRKDVEEYLEGDLRATMEVYQMQRKAFLERPKLLNLFRLHMQDLLVLEEMEWNGLKLNIDKTNELAEQTKERLKDIEKTLGRYCPTVPINWNSGDQLSAYLYGGVVEVERKEPAGFFKTGLKAGQLKFKTVVDRHVLPRLVEPHKGSELKKADLEAGTGPWSVAEDVLTQLKQIEPVKLLLERAKLSKLLDYVGGFPELLATKDWPDNTLHGQYNQAIARTGRLSSSSPNLQNLPDQVLGLIETRYL